MATTFNKTTGTDGNGANGRAALERPDFQTKTEGTQIPDTAAAALGRRLAELEKQLRDLEQLAPLFAALRDQADGLASTQQRVDVRLTRAADDVDRIQRQMERLSDSVEVAMSLGNDISRLEGLIPETKDQLAELEGLTARVVQKVDSLEQKSTVIDSAAARLDTVVREIADVGAKQEDQVRQFAELKAHAEGLESLDAEVLGRLEEIRLHQVQIDAHDQATLEELAAIRTAAQKSGERVDLAYREFDALNGRMVELSAGLDNMEARFGLLEESEQTLSGMRTQIEGLSKRLSSINEERSSLDELERRMTEAESLHAEVMDRSEQIRIHQSQIDEKAESAGKESSRLRSDVQKAAEEVDEVRAAVDAVARDKAELERVSKAIAEGMEQARIVYAEIREIRDEQAETERWLAELQDSVGRVHGSIEGLIGVQPRVEEVRREAERVSLAMSAIDSGRETLEDMDKRLRELQALGVRLDEGKESVPPAAEERITGRPRWHFDADFNLDRSTWELGIQFRLRGRTKRGLAVWLGPIRWFVGWARRYPVAASAAGQVGQFAAPAEANDEEAPDGQ